MVPAALLATLWRLAIRAEREEACQGNICDWMVITFKYLTLAKMR